METTSTDIYVVIVAGGTGTRLWPLSRKSRPKQFLNIIGPDNFIQQVYRRAKQIVSDKNIFIVAPDNYAQYLQEYIPEFPLTNFMGEPTKKGTTAAYGYTATYIKQLNPNAILHIIAADDYIVDNIAYKNSLTLAADLVKKENALVIYGAKPRDPNTGYGYVQVDLNSKTNSGSAVAYTVKFFHEKPPLDLARQYLAAGDYYWHCFGFTISVPQLLELIKIHDPKTFTVLQEIEADLKLPSRLESAALRSHYEKIEESNIENQILEKTELKRYMVALEDTWSDVGSWDHVYELKDKDENGNVVLGLETKVYQYNTKNCLLMSKTKPLALVDLDNLVIIETDDVIMIADKNKAQDVKKLVDDIKKNNVTKLI